MTSRWVICGKMMVDGTLAIRARFRIRGSQDLRQDTLKTFSVTVSRQGQRSANFIAADCREFVLFVWDAGSNLIKGLTFAEVSNLTCDSLQTVQVDLLQDTFRLTRTFKELADSYPLIHGSETMRLGFGLKGAPRLWNLRLRQVMTKMQMASTISDPQFLGAWMQARGNRFREALATRTKPKSNFSRTRRPCIICL